MAVQMSPVLEEVSAQSGPGIVISELRFSGPNGVSDEFIELYNASSADIEIGGWQVRVSGSQSTANALRTTIPASDKSLVRPGCYYLITFTAGPGGYSGAVTGDHTYGTGFADDGGVAVGPLSVAPFADQVGFHIRTLYFERNPIAGGFSTLNRSFERIPGGGNGHVDTNNNLADFQLIVESNPQVTHLPNPQNSSSACVVAETVVKPHAVQGSGAASPMAGVVKTVQGVVTARARDGFFIQTEVDQDDDNDFTSEGLFVFTGVGPAVPVAAQVGRVVKVTGAIEEFVPASDHGSASRTQLRLNSLTDLGAGTVPAAYVLTLADLSSTGTLGQLERLEGMRVTAPSLTAVSGTASDGVFYAVLAGEARPFRTAGVEAGYPVLPCAAGSSCNVPLFDGNPERLRVDSDGIENVNAAHLSSAAVMSNVTGPLDFGSRTYTLLPEAALAPVGGMGLENLAATPANRFTVASFNATRFGDVSEAVWAKKAALALQSSMGLPDVVALQGVDNAALTALVAESPGYTPVYVAGSDVAFLLKSRVSAVSFEPVGAPDMFAHPSLILRAVVDGGSTSLPQSLTVLVNHLEPVNGVLAKRQAQANFLADYVHGLQMNNEAFVVVGDFNAFSFNDGYVDTVGTVRGVPAPANQVAFETSSPVLPALLDLGAALAPEAQYSFVLNGNAQTHEHVLASANLASLVAGVARPRVNGDFPDVWRGDPLVPTRVSVKDPVVSYFSFPPDVDAPVFDPIAEAVTAEATGPNGAVVNFPTPTATDNLDDVVEVRCLPVSGSQFRLGDTTVTCSATDAANNPAQVSFIVTVEDTTAPVITVPEGITEEATSAAGRVVTYQAWASDAVSGTLVPSCSPVSGSQFPLGSTGVVCSARDAAGNPAQVMFAVTVADTTAPVITVPDDISEQATSPEGRVVTYSVTAHDAVSGPLVPSCSPESGSTFPIGTTDVSCMVSDAAGHVGEAHFSVSISQQSLPGRMHGAGTLGASQQRVSFSFAVGESADGTERGWLMVHLKDGSGRPRYVAGMVDDVTFSNAVGYGPGLWPESGVDTVVFSGVGYWNGRSGYHFQVTASDRGEPGVNDTFALVVTSPTGQVVESASGLLRGGNIQSLR